MQQRRRVDTLTQSIATDDCNNARRPSKDLISYRLTKITTTQRTKYVLIKLVMLSVSLMLFHCYLEPYGNAAVVNADFGGVTERPYTIFAPLWSTAALDLLIHPSSYLGRNKSQVVIFYFAFGPSRLGSRSLAEACRRRGLDCRRLQHHSDRITNEENITATIFSNIWSYCQHHNGLVAYLPMSDDEAAATSVLTGQACWSASQKHCSVCGRDFDPLHMILRPTQSFVASCSLVRQLVAPVQFAFRLQQARQLARQSTTPKFLFSPTFSQQKDPSLSPSSPVDRWILSHPDAQPCRLVNTTHTAIGPTHVIKTPADFRYWRLADMKDEDVRLKEYGLLAGRLWEWTQLYDQVPDDRSWAYNVFPDGLYWRSMAKEHGTRLFENL